MEGIREILILGLGSIILDNTNISYIRQELFILE